jgi:hypothetical protein
MCFSTCSWRCGWCRVGRLHCGISAFIDLSGHTALLTAMSLAASTGLATCQRLNRYQLNEENAWAGDLEALENFIILPRGTCKRWHWRDGLKRGGQGLASLGSRKGPRPALHLGYRAPAQSQPLLGHTVKGQPMDS